jgi:hypothetical protein
MRAFQAPGQAPLKPVPPASLAAFPHRFARLGLRPRAHHSRTSCDGDARSGFPAELAQTGCCVHMALAVHSFPEWPPFLCRGSTCCLRPSRFSPSSTIRCRFRRSSFTVSTSCYQAAGPSTASSIGRARGALQCELVLRNGNHDVRARDRLVRAASPPAPGLQLPRADERLGFCAEGLRFRDVAGVPATGDLERAPSRR